MAIETHVDIGPYGQKKLLFPRITETRREGRERLGGLLRYYHQDAA
jgi:hypothetical protein